MHASQFSQKGIPIDPWTGPTPSGLVEYGFHFYMCYVLLGGVFGVVVSNLASALLLLLIFLCLYEVGSHTIAMIRLVAFPLGCAVGYMFIQLFFFEESLEGTFRPFLIWMLTVVLIQSLASRKNFLHRFAVVMLFIGLAALPYISFDQIGTKYQRVQLDRAIGFAHTNAMGEWYGFCALYFVVLAYATKKNALRILSLAIAIGCFYVMTLTVSRGALLATAVAIVVASRHLLKRGFFPVLLVVSIGSMVVALGVFDQSVQSYSQRGTEDTGRLAVWPLIIDSFLDSPFIGVGNSNVGATTDGHFRTPHNGFLYIAQASGVVPLALFIAYWLRSGMAAHQAVVGGLPDAAFYFPLLTFTFITVNLSGVTFMTFWAIVSLAIPMTATYQRQTVDLPSQLNKRVGTPRFEIAK